MKPVNELPQLRFTQLVLGLQPSPAIPGNVLIHHIEKYQSKYPELTKQLKRSFYVDQLVAGASDINDVVEFYKKARKIMADGGMNLIKWKSNPPKLMKQIKGLRRSRKVSPI